MFMITFILYLVIGFIVGGCIIWAGVGLHDRPSYLLMIFLWPAVVIVVILCLLNKLCEMVEKWITSKRKKKK